MSFPLILIHPLLPPWCCALHCHHCRVDHHPHCSHCQRFPSSFPSLQFSYNTAPPPGVVHAVHQHHSDCCCRCYPHHFHHTQKMQPNAHHPHERTITTHTCLSPHEATMINGITHPPTPTKMTHIWPHCITSRWLLPPSPRNQIITAQNPSFTNNSYLYGNYELLCSDVDKSKRVW